MDIKPLLHKWWVWLILIVCFLLLIFSLLISRFLNPWLQDKLETTVQEQTDGLYTLQLHGLDTSLLGGSISADSVRLTPDFAVWESKSEAAETDSAGNAQAPPSLVNLEMGALKIAGINFIGLLRGQPLDVRRVMLQNPQITITEMRQDTSEAQKPLHESVQGIAKNAQVKQIEIREGTLRIKPSKDAEAAKISLDSFSVNVRDLRLDSTSLHDKERAYYASSIAMESGKASYLLPDGTYRVQASALKANTEDGTLNVGNLKLVPLLEPAALSRKKGMAKTTMKVDIPEINVSGIAYATHSLHNNLVAKHVVLSKPSISAYLDRKNFPQKGNKPLPHDLVQQLKTGLNIRKIEVKGMYVRYEELAPEAVETGIITFENFYATITNVTNDKNLMSAKTPAVVDAKASINGDVPIALTIRLDLLDKNAYHTIQGTAGPGNPATLNSILEPTAFLSIKEGQLQESDFNIELYRNKATGNLNVRYSNFKVDVLTKDADTRQSLGKKIMSKVANKFVIKSNNPEEGEELRPGEIDVVRAKSRSVFNYWKDSLVSGFRSAAGIEGIGANLQDPNRN